MIGRTIREYKIVAEIGQGAMGKVYLAEHSVLGQCALKAMDSQVARDPQLRERFAKEAKAQFGLKHPNIVQLNNFMEDMGELFLVMEYVGGLSLDKRLAGRGALPEKEALSIIKGVLSGLNYAHSQGVIHRDIKPSNILLASDGTPKIADFGIALLLGSQRLTRTGANIGTAQYMSPEQIVSPKNLD
ncbi:MAG: serine/threonine-protein kinase, partial [Pseudomonadota bacterium]